MRDKEGLKIIYVTKLEINLKNSCTTQRKIRCKEDVKMVSFKAFAVAKSFQIPFPVTSPVKVLRVSKVMK